MAARQAGRGAEALERLEELTRKLPSCALAWSELAWTYSSMRRREDAAGAMMRALELLPESGELWLRQAFLEEELGRPDPAVAAYRHAWEHLPEARVELRASTRRRIVELGGDPPGDAGAQAPAEAAAAEHLQNALTLHRDGRHSAAERHLAKALALGGETAEALAFMGKVLADQGRYEDALHYLKRACRLEPGDAEAWLERAQALERLGRYAEAVRCLQRFLASASPSHDERPLVSRRLDVLQQRVLEQEGEAAEAAARSIVHSHRLHLAIAAVAALLVFQVVFRFVYGWTHDEAGGTRGAAHTPR